VRANPNDPRWNTIDRNRYHFVAAKLRAENFFAPQKAAAALTYIQLQGQATTEEYIEAIRNRGWMLPTRAEVESFHDLNPSARRQSLVVGVCGPRVNRDGLEEVPCINASRRGIELKWHWLTFLWPHNCRFLAAVSR
jgi:hypothetical protein